jgi:hypothetical protein
MHRGLGLEEPAGKETARETGRTGMPVVPSPADPFLPSSARSVPSLHHLLLYSPAPDAPFLLAPPHHGPLLAAWFLLRRMATADDLPCSMAARVCEREEEEGERRHETRWWLGPTMSLHSQATGSAMTGVPHTRRGRTGRHGRPLHSRPSGMRHEKTVLPLAVQQKHMDSHRVSLLSFPPTQDATRRPSPTGGPRTTHAPHIRDRGCVSSQGGCNFGAKLCFTRTARIDRWN